MGSLGQILTTGVGLGLDAIKVEGGDGHQTIATPGMTSQSLTGTTVTLSHDLEKIKEQIRATV